MDCSEQKTLVVEDQPGVFRVACPGCREWHVLYSKEYKNSVPKWTFNRNFDSPTFSPSLLVRYLDRKSNERRRCHSYIRNGQWQFLSDSTHDLGGQTVPMIDMDTFNHPRSG